MLCCCQCECESWLIKRAHTLALRYYFCVIFARVCKSFAPTHAFGSLRLRILVHFGDSVRVCVCVKRLRFVDGLVIQVYVSHFFATSCPLAYFIKMNQEAVVRHTCTRNLHCPTYKGARSERTRMKDGKNGGNAQTENCVHVVNLYLLGSAD